MDTTPAPFPDPQLSDSQPQHAETDDGRTARLTHERVLLEQARGDVRAGRVVADEDVDSWLDRLVSGEALPIPDTPRAG